MSVRVLLSFIFSEMSHKKGLKFMMGINSLKNHLPLLVLFKNI